MELETLRIGDLAAATGVSVRALRYYEEHGLLQPERTPSGQRIYDPDAVERVRLLRRLYAAGLTSTNIAALLPCVDAPSEQVTAESVSVMEGEHARLSRQILELTTARDQLGFLIATAVGFRQEQSAAAA